MDQRHDQSNLRQGGVISGSAPPSAAMVMDAEQPKAGGATPAAETGIAQKLSHGLERVQPLGAPTSQETPRDTARMMLREIQSPRQDPLDMDELPIYRHAVLTMGTASAYG
ncbi:hypothetical protein DIZ76_010209 [Coccidioides immitis]|nr:hypothetical protein DIZ76_010209 [Coccidioides immitis]